MPNFNELLQIPADSIKKPPTLPAGTYFGLIKGGAGGKDYEFGESKEKKTPFVRYFLSLTEAGQDVDPGQLAEVDLTKKVLRKDFYLTPDSMFRLKDFIASTGVSTAGRTLQEIIPEAVGKRVIIVITQRASQDGTDLFNDVGDVKGA